MKSRFYPWRRNKIAGHSQHGIDLHGWFILKWRRIESLGGNLMGILHRSFYHAFPNLRRNEMARPQEQFDMPEPDEGYTLVQVDGDSPMLVKDNATYQDVIDAPEHQLAELISGKLYLMSRPARRHSRAVLELIGLLNSPFSKGIGGPGGWEIHFEPELHLIKDIKVVEPDIAGWQEHSWHLLPDGNKFTVMPDWVCEVLSPSTRKKDLEVKHPEYARASIPYSWIIDPIAKSLKAYELQSGAWVQIADLKDDDAVSVPPFNAITFSLAELWNGPKGTNH